ncbi:type IX secretion system motor protein PorM/GldM [Myroides sp. LJL115]
MAKQKLTPRQKMINLMYLVFIAMMALQMSREVLSAFGMVNTKFEQATATIESNNKNVSLAQLKTRAEDDPTRYKEAYQTALKTKDITDYFVNEVEKSKDLITSTYRAEDGTLPFESMDQSSVIDNAWFIGDKLSDQGQAFLTLIEKYKDSITNVLGVDVSYNNIKQEIDENFNLAPIVNKDGNSEQYLTYNFYGFPAIASLTKLSAMQNDARMIESDIYNLLLGNTLIEAASMRKYKPLVISDKTTYFAGEMFTGKVVLGRYDDSTVPTEVVVNNKKIDLSTALKNGEVNISFPVGNVGEHDIRGKFVFKENGELIPLDIDGGYVVVSSPNSATISADKMNVVYRGISNPMTISFAGIPSDKVVASAPGLTKGSKAGQYFLNPQAGREVTIKVSGTLPGGKVVTDSQVFRIKDIPAPRGTIRGVFADSGPKANLEIATVGAQLEDFDFEVKLSVTGFVLQVPGQPSVVVQGNRMSDRAKAAIRRARVGDIVVISDIKTRLDGAGSYQLKRTAPATYEIR